MAIFDSTPPIETKVQEEEILTPGPQDLPDSIPVPAFVKDEADRQLFGQKLCDWISQADSAKGSMVEIWARIAMFNRDDPAGMESAPDQGMAPLHRPYISVRTGTLGAQMTSVIATPDPLMLCDSAQGDDELASRLEKALHRQWVSGGFNQALGEVIQNAILFNKGIWRIAFDLQFDEFLPEGADAIEAQPGKPMRYAGLKVGSVHPNDFVIAPTTVDGPQSAQLIGERFYRRKDWCIEQERLGLFFEGSTADLSTSTPVEHDNLRAITASMTSPSAAAQTPETESVELHEIYLKYPESPGEPERWFKAIAATHDAKVLTIQHWPYSRPPYFISGVEVDTLHFWGTKSIGRSAIPMQDQYNKYHSLLYNGNYAQAEYFLVGQEPVGEKYTEIPQGRFLKSDGPVTAMQLPFKGDSVQTAISNLETDGDKLFGVTNNAQGVPDQKVSITATQSQQLAMGASTRLANFLFQFELPFPQMAAFSAEILADQFQAWGTFDPAVEKEADFGDEDDPTASRGLTRGDFEQAVFWQANGRTPNSTPMAILAELQQLMAVAQSSPASGLDEYEIMKAYLQTAAIAGSRKFQKERPPDPPPQEPPLGSPQPQQPKPPVPGIPAMAGHPGPSIPPQVTDQGEHLPPNEAASVRPIPPGHP